MSESSDIKPGTRLGPYTLGDQIGQGASATVFLGQDRGGRPFAIKVRRRGQADMDRRFLREFESMRLLRVPGVVPVHEAGIEDEYLWFSMDRVFGRPFHEGLHDEPYLIERVERTIDLGRQLCTILTSLHEAGFVHRDVKPPNVLVDAGGEVHVLDFGIGRYFGESDTLSSSGEVLGTVPYMAPEQLSGLPCDEKVDLFAVGLMLHEAIAGKRQRPLTTVGWIPKICLERLPPLARLFREVPRGLSHLVEAMLSVDPRDRPTAREAALELQRVGNRLPSAEWPEPMWVDPGDWWLPLEGCIGHGEHPPVWVLEGPAGSGRGRLAEQLHRNALLQGTWPINVRCRNDRVGAPILELIEWLVARLDDDTLATVVGEAAGALRQMWPHLPLPLAGATTELPSTGGIADALARIVGRAIARRPMLLVVHDLEQVDLFTARVLPLLAQLCGDNLGLLLLHENRWSTATSKQLVATLRRDHQAGVLTVPRFSADAANQMAAQLCPESPPTFDRPTSAIAVMEAAWKALADWRGEPFVPPDSTLWPLTVRDAPVPLSLYKALTEPGAAEGPWVRTGDGGVVLSGPTARAMARSRMGNLRRSAASLATNWERTLGHRPGGAGQLASLWLLAGDHAKAWAPAAQAAVHAEEYELYADARHWLLLLDTLPPAQRRDPHEDFELAFVQARVALFTDAVSVRPALADLAETLARSPEQEHRCRVLRAEYDLRQGVVRPALVAALRVGSSPSGAPPLLQVRALLLAVRCRVTLRQLTEALRELERAEAALAEHSHALLEVKASNQRAELALLQEDLLWCRALCQKNIRSASQHRYVRGIAEAAHRLGQVLRMLGRRREAEHQIRSAREAFAATGDVALDAETGLALATLLVERGEALPARHLLDETIRRVRGLSMDHLLPSGMRVALQVATLTGDQTDATLALVGLAEVGSIDSETPAAAVHWWRSRGDTDQALAVAGPEETRSFGAVLWHLERSRAALAGGRTDLAIDEARTALDQATTLGFAELQIYARLVLGSMTDLEEEAWAELLRRATSSMYTEVFLGALEMDARRLQRTRPDQARQRWRVLLARARELGYRPGVEEASGWLQDDAAP